jgi:acetone carboxylase gamma subunit
MRKRWQNESVAFVRDDPEFKRLVPQHGKPKAARMRIVEMMAEECERLGDHEAAARLREDVK